MRHFIVFVLAIFSWNISFGSQSSPSSMLRGTMSVNNLGNLEIGGVDVVNLAKSSEYPIYIVDESLLRKNMHDYVSSINKYYKNPGYIFYASKALVNKSFCKIAEFEGMGLDVSTGGELYTAIESNFPMERVIMHGNNKSEQEIKLAVENDVGRIVIDNLDDIAITSSISKSMKKVTKVLVRVKPGIYAHTHSHIATGSNESKFGFMIDDKAAEEAINITKTNPSLKFLGLHVHIGSQILEIEDYMKAIDHTVKFVKELKSKGINVEELNLGGGLGVVYTDKDKKIEIENFVKEISQYVTEKFNEHGLLLPKLMLEPGRSIVGEAGTTVYTIGSTKNSKNQIYAAVNGGMNDNIRSCLYQARYYAVIANKMNHDCNNDVKIVGKSCESGDVLIEQIFLPKPQRGDILAIFSTGAYNYSMASNYNRIPVPGMVLVKNGKVKWIVKPQTLKDILRNDLLPKELN